MCVKAVCIWDYCVTVLLVVWFSLADLLLLNLCGGSCVIDFDSRLGVFCLILSLIVCRVEYAAAQQLLCCLSNSSLFGSLSML